MPGRLAQDVKIQINGQGFRTEPGICVAAALLKHGHQKLRHSPNGNPRGAFCMMGVCQECLVRIDGRVVQACLTAVVDGMAIETEHQA